jgi:hypothetical protein
MGRLRVELLLPDVHNTTQAAGHAFHQWLDHAYTNGRPPSQGGMYMPKCPEVELRGMFPYAREKRRPYGEARA